MTALRKFGTWLAATGVVALAACALLYAAGARINTTKSVPVGLYWASDEVATKGAYVLFCPPQVGVIAEAKRRGYLSGGFCPGGYGYMMKKIVATKNDAVTISDAGVSVNGTVLPFSAPLSRDRAGRPLPRYQTASFIVGNSELLFMSDRSGTSFDARYFGPVSRVQVKTVVVPVATW